jgi:hypothetical protein
MFRTPYIRPLGLDMHLHKETLVGDWEKFCESRGMSVGSPDDYDHLIRSLEDRPPRFRRDVGVYFNSFQEAKAWAMRNVGRAFTRSTDGTGFVPSPRGVEGVKPDA